MSNERESLALPANTTVGRYQLRQVEGSWGFYLTYLGEASGTAQRVLVHELLPEELARRAPDGTVQARTESAAESLAWARERFLREGRGLAACAHPAIQTVLDVFEANGTAYWVTPPEEARSLKRWLEALHRPPAEAELRTLLAPLLSAVQKLHAAGLHHLNLKLDSIRMSAEGKPLLIHFAGSRQAIARHSHEATAVTTGYSPIEQYDSDKAEGPWTDIYGLGAVLHRAITGQVPPEATSRLTSDPYQKLAGRFSGQYRADFLSAIDGALAPDPAARPQSIEGWRKMLGLPAEDLAPSLVRRKTALLTAAALVFAALLGGGAWYVFRPRPVPPLVNPSDEKSKITAADKNQDQKNDADQKQDAEEKKKREDEKKAAEAKAEEERRKAEEAKLAEAEKKAEEETTAAEKDAADKAAAAQQAEESAAQKAEAAQSAAGKADAEKAAAEEAATKAEEAKGASKKKAAEKKADAAAEKANQAQSAADQAAADGAAADVAAKQAELEKAQAERKAAEKAVAQKSIEQERAEAAKEAAAAEASVVADQNAAQKAAAEKAAAGKAAQNAEAGKAAAQQTAREKAAAEKEAAQKLAAAIAAQNILGARANSQNTPGKNAESEKAAAEKAAADKGAAEKAAAEKAAAEKAAAEKAAAEKAAAEKAAAEKAAAEKAAAEKAAQEVAAQKAAEEKAAADKQKSTPSPGQPNQQPSGFSGPQGQVGSGLGGVWETSAKAASGEPLKRLIIYPDATYELHSEGGSETGFIKAKLGIMELHRNNSDDGVVSTFTYKSMRVIDTDGPLGKFEWVRVSPTAPDRPKKEGQ